MKRIIIIAFIISLSVMNAQSKFSLGVNGGYAVGNSTFQDVFKSGRGGVVTLDYSLSENLKIAATSGYIDFLYNNDNLHSMLTEAGFTSMGSTNTKLSLIPVMLGVKYIPFETKVRPYLQLDFGVHFLKASNTNIDVSGQEVLAIGETDEVKAAFAGGVGFLYEILPNFCIDVITKINANNEEFTKTSYIKSTNTYKKESSKTIFTTIACGFVVGL